MQISMSCHKYAALPLYCAVFLFTAFVCARHASPQELITFDAPGAGTGGNTGTFPTGINLRGEITGNVVTEDNFAEHGFLRTPKGEITEFDAPGADPIRGCTCPVAINHFGVIAGNIIDANYVSHGFVRTPDGEFSVVDAPGASRRLTQGTTPLMERLSSIGVDVGGVWNGGTTLTGINNFGVVTGYFIDNSTSVVHGFVRTPEGEITPFDDPAAGSGFLQGTYPNSINDFGAISGSIIDSNRQGHGFLRTRRGEFVDFNFGDGAAFLFDHINDRGVIEGSATPEGDINTFGFLRLADGKIVTFDAPVANAGGFQRTWVYGLNDWGTATGSFSDTDILSEAFVRYADGQFFMIDVPGQISSQGTAINAKGTAVGNWFDRRNGAHGFIWSQKELHRGMGLER